MTKITASEDCGSSTEKQLIREFSIALANQDIDTAMSMVSGDIYVSVPGYDEARGKDAVRSLLLADMKQSDATELIVKNILIDGDRCAADGVWKFVDGGEVAFCTMYALTDSRKGAKIRGITTYAVILTESVRL